MCIDFHWRVQNNLYILESIPESVTMKLIKCRAVLRRSGNALVLAVPKAIAFNMKKGHLYDFEVDLDSETAPSKGSKYQKKLEGTQ